MINGSKPFAPFAEGFYRWWKILKIKLFQMILRVVLRICFEIGAQKMLLGNNDYLSEDERNKLEKNIEKRQKEIQDEKQEENLHSEMQFHLLKIGQSLGYDAFVAPNDRSKSYAGHSFSFMNPDKFPAINCDKETANTIKLIDVLWFEKGTNKVICAFEVEKSTSIYSGILRLTDLSYSIATGNETFYLVVPESREKDVVLQLSLPSIKQIRTPIEYILFSELRQHCDALCKFGDSHQIMAKIAKTV
jgi:type II restriction enzyme